MKSLRAAGKDDRNVEYVSGQPIMLYFGSARLRGVAERLVKQTERLMLRAF